MTTDSFLTARDEQKRDIHIQNQSADAVYGLGLIGAWVFYIGRATTNRERVAGFFKGIFWPAYLVYEVLAYLRRDDSEAGSPPPEA